jgi:hypothetical protein
VLLLHGHRDLRFKDQTGGIRACSLSVTARIHLGVP